MFDSRPIKEQANDAISRIETGLATGISSVADWVQYVEVKFYVEHAYTWKLTQALHLLQFSRWIATLDLEGDKRWEYQPANARLFDKKTEMLYSIEINAPYHNYEFEVIVEQRNKEITRFTVKKIATLPHKFERDYSELMNIGAQRYGNYTLCVANFNAEELMLIDERNDIQIECLFSRSAVPWKYQFNLSDGIIGINEINADIAHQICAIEWEVSER